jgi:hypothetical protein
MSDKTQAVPTTCPQCGFRFAAPVHPVIDAGKNPAMKRRFLQGKLNVAICPQCGNQGLVNATFLYHDPEQEMLLAFMPQDLQLRNQDEQRIIGDLTNSLLASLPPEERKGYLLQPKTFLTIQSLIKEVMAAEGITDEVIEAQAAKARLVGRFLSAASQEELQELISENEDELDYEFFQVLTAMMEEATEDGQPQLARQLGALRAALAKMSSKGREAAAQVDVGESLSREELLERIVQTSDQAELEQLVTVARPLLDYSFFQALTARIEKAQQEGRGEEAERLKKTRSRILDIAARLDKQAKAAIQQAADLLGEAIQSDDPETLLRERLEQIDNIFLLVLSANLQEAERQGQNEAVEVLQKISETTFRLLEERMPPELRFVNQLLRLPYPEGTRQLMESQREMLTPQLIDGLKHFIDSLRDEGQLEGAQHVEQVMEQVRAVMEEQAIVTGR